MGAAEESRLGTRLRGRFCGRHLSRGLPIIPRICFTTTFPPLWLISKLLLRTEPFHKDWAPWRMAELCEMFWAVLSRKLPLNLSVFISENIPGCSPQVPLARVNSGSSLRLVWHPLPVPSIGIRPGQGGVGGEQCHSVLTVPFAMAAGACCFCFPTQKNLPQSPVHPFGPKEGDSFHKCYRCKNAKAGALNVTWI